MSSRHSSMAASANETKATTHWLAVSAARAERTLRSIPPSSMGPAGRRLLAAISIQTKDTEVSRSEQVVVDVDGAAVPTQMTSLPTHPSAPTKPPSNRQLPLISPVKEV